VVGCRKNISLGDLPQVPDEDIPYRRTYSRVLVALAVLLVPLFLLLPEASSASSVQLRPLVALFGLSIASLWCPVLIYAGIRTRCTVDVVVGCVGTATLLIWGPLFFALLG